MAYGKALEAAAQEGTPLSAKQELEWLLRYVSVLARLMVTFGMHNDGVVRLAGQTQLVDGARCLPVFDFPSLEQRLHLASEPLLIDALYISGKVVSPQPW